MDLNHPKPCPADPWKRLSSTKTVANCQKGWDCCSSVLTSGTDLSYTWASPLFMRPKERVVGVVGWEC